MSEQQSGQTASPYAEILNDIELSSYMVWDTARKEAVEQKLETPALRGGAPGILWSGALLHAMEEVFPQLGGDARVTQAANAVRRLIHQYLTRQGLMHCDKPSRGRGGNPSTWWIRGEWEPQPRRDPSYWADPVAPVVEEIEDEAEAQSPEEPEFVTFYGDDAETILAQQMLRIILAAAEVGAPLTATALRQIPTMTGPWHRSRILTKLVDCGAVEARTLRVPSGHSVTVYVGAEDAPELPEIPSLSAGVVELDAADVLAQFLADYRQLSQELNEAQAKLSIKDSSASELASLREQLAVIKRALGH